MNKLLHARFLRSAEAYPQRPAVVVEGRTVSYCELRQAALSIAASLQRWASSEGPQLTGVFAYRSVTAFAGVLAALLRGHGYVPLNRTFPPERTTTMLNRAGCRAIIVDRGSESQLPDILDETTHELLVILPEREETDSLKGRFPKHTFLGREDLEPAKNWREAATATESIAYLLFTSGSTGLPKGVMVSHGNVGYFVDVMVERYQITSDDRLSQTFDMTFDLSAFDMFVAWERGACVCCPTPKTLLNPARWIRDSCLTVWFSVPSVGIFMKRFGTLQPNSFPGLRWSLFCGEPLPVEVARAWAEAAPHSIIENLYGPTELTISCCLYRWRGNESERECHLGIVPIGEPYPGMHLRVVDEELREVQEGSDGELLMTGPQLALGYWQDSAKTAQAFVVPPGDDRVYYRTGDRVRKPVASNPLLYLGRTDHQIKVLGHRVELGEVEAALRKESGVQSVAALGWPLVSAGAAGIVAFIGERSLDTVAIRAKLQTQLPSYAVPREIHLLSNLPLNPNGKIDRKALLSIMEKAS